jgi:hypothetical protein
MDELLHTEPAARLQYGMVAIRRDRGLWQSRKRVAHIKDTDMSHRTDGVRKEGYESDRQDQEGTGHRSA